MPQFYIVWKIEVRFGAAAGTGSCSRVKYTPRSIVHVKDTFFVVGPTAVGKTALAIELAEKFDAEIVNADAFQVYRGLDILTAKPDAEAQAPCAPSSAGTNPVI